MGETTNAIYYINNDILFGQGSPKADYFAGKTLQLLEFMIDVGGLTLPDLSQT
jgi:hypothetical protein